MRARIIEVGPRDGLQNEKKQIPSEAKIAFIDALSKSGVDEIEVSSFVSPKWIPQLADAYEVFEGIQRREDVVYSALIPNFKGLERSQSLSTPPDKLAIFAAASETFSQKNTNGSIDEVFERFVPVAQGVLELGRRLRGYVSCAWHCPYEGKIDPQAVLRVCQRLQSLGCEEISIGDTVGRAQPDEVGALLKILLEHFEPQTLAMHFHDTFGRAAENVRVSFQSGVLNFDASVGGLGGCPYAGPGAPGNVATQTVVRTLREAGAEIDVDIDQLSTAKALLDRYFMPFKHPQNDAP